MKYNRCWSYKRSLSLNIISTSDGTDLEPLKPVKRFDKQSRETQRNESSRNPPRNNRREKVPSKKFPIRQGGNSYFRSEGINKEQMRNEPGTAASRLTVDDEAFKGRTKPHSEPGVESSNLVNEINQVHPGENHLLIHQTLVSPACKTSAERVYKSRLVPPRPAKDIILDNKVRVWRIMAAGKQGCPTQEKQAASSDTDVVQKCLSAIDHVSCSGGEVVPDIPTLGANQNKINEFNASTTEENEFVDKMAQDDGEECENKKVLTDFAENETIVMMDETIEVLKNKDDLSCSGLSEDPNFETKLEPSELETIIEETSGTPEKLRISEEELGREADKIQEKIQDNSSECFECQNQIKTPKSSTLPTVDPVQMLKDWRGLETTIQSMLRGFFENQGFAAETFPDILGSLNQQISHFKEILKNIAENVSDQHDTVNQESIGRMMGIKLSVEDEVPLKDLPEVSKTPEDPESMEQSAAGCSAFVKDRLASESPELLLQTNDFSLDSREVCEDIQGPPARDDQEATGKTSKVMFSICKFKGEVTESSREEKPAASFVDIEEEKQSQNNPMVTSCSKEFVLVEPYFAESAKTKRGESGSDQGLVDPSRNQEVEVVAKKREIAHRSQSCLVNSVEETVEMQLKSHQTLSANSDVGGSSKVRRLLETTADEIKAMVVPELVLMSLQEGRIEEGRQIDKSTGSNTEDLEELSVGDIDSCEEVDEEAAQQPATQQRQPETEVIVENVKVFPVTSSVKHPRGRKGFGLNSRKDKNKTDCKIS